MIPLHLQCFLLLSVTLRFQTMNFCPRSIGICPVCSTPQCPAFPSGQPSQDTAVYLVATIPTVVLLVANVLTGTVVFLITRHCLKNTHQKTATSVQREDVYDQVVISKSSGTIQMTDLWPCEVEGPCKVYYIYSKLMHCNINLKVLASLYASNNSSVICIVLCYGSVGKTQIFVVWSVKEIS